MEDSPQSSALSEIMPLFKVGYFNMHTKIAKGSHVTCRHIEPLCNVYSKLNTPVSAEKHSKPFPLPRVAASVVNLTQL